MFEYDGGQRLGPASMTGLAEVLESYATRGGQLLGSRRWSENPLTLTHVRWQGAQGVGMEAVRRPDDDGDLSPDERDVWVQLALGFPATYMGPSSWDAPWVPLAVSPEVAGRMAVRVPRSWPGMRPSGADPRSFGAGTYPPHHPPAAPPYGAIPPAIGANPPAPPAYPPRSPIPPYADEMGDAGYADGRAWTGGLRREALLDDGVTAIPCAEFEMPMAVMGSAGTEPAGDFIRDVAINFRRATHGLPYVRETRGWLRNQRLVLAVRMVIAPGARPATQAEMQEAARLLAGALARNTLPYARLAFAEPGEWAQGRPLSD